jgi:peroxiredoxin Q/BCP
MAHPPAHSARFFCLRSPAPSRFHFAATGFHDGLGCTVEACAFRDAHQRFVDAGTTVVGVSRDDEASHARFAAHHELPFLLLSDPTGEVHRQYGASGRLAFANRVTYVIDRAGVVRYVFDSKVRMRAHVDRSLDVARELAAVR